MESLIESLTASIEVQVKNDPSWLSQWLICFSQEDGKKLRECVTLLTRNGLTLTQATLKTFSLTLSKMGKSPQELIANLAKTDLFPLLEFYLPPRSLIQGYTVEGEFVCHSQLEKIDKINLHPDLKKILVNALHHAESVFSSLPEKEKELWIERLKAKVEPEGQSLLEKFMDQLTSVILHSLRSVESPGYLDLVNTLTNNSYSSIDFFFYTSLKKKKIDPSDDLKNILERNLHPLIVNPSAVSAVDNYLIAFKKKIGMKEVLSEWGLESLEEEDLYQEFLQILISSLESLKTEDEILASDVSKAMISEPRLSKIYNDLFV